MIEVSADALARHTVGKLMEELEEHPETNIRTQLQLLTVYYLFDIAASLDVIQEKIQS